MIHEVHERIAFNVEFTTWPVLEQTSQLRHIITPDMSFVGAGMHGDTGSTCFQSNGPHQRHRGRITITRVANQSDFIEIDREIRKHGCANILVFKNRV